MLTELGRRVLVHLPVWAEDEDAHIAAEGGPGQSVRSYNLESFTRRLAEDTNVHPPQTELDNEQTLEALVAAGLAEKTPDEQWRMTKAGYDAIHAPREDVEQVPGEIFLDLQPGHATMTASTDGT